MSNNLSSQQLSIPGNQIQQLEPISSKLGTPMSMGLMGFGIDEPLQQQIRSNMVIGQMGSVSNNLGSQLSSMSNLQGKYVESQACTQLSQQYLLSNKPVGVMIPDMLGSMRPHQLPTLNKRKEPMEPIAPNSLPKKLSLPNKQTAEMEHRSWLQSFSAPSKRSVQMQSVSSVPGSEPSPTSNKRSVPNKFGSSASRNQPAQMRPSSKVQSESFQSVRSKMRESLAGALALVSQQQGENAMVRKNSNGEAANFAGNAEGGSHPVDSGSGKSGGVLSISTEPQGRLISDQDGAAGGNNSEGTRVVQCSEQQFRSSNLLADEELRFTDNIFSRDELLQGNGLSWVLESDLVAVKKTETVKKQDLDNEKMGKDGLEQSLQSPQELAFQIEAELFKLFGGVNKKYKEKGRSLLFNLKDRSNPELRESVVSGKITPHRLCSMSAEELASKELSEWRQAKAEEFAQMVVLPDEDVDIRRLVRKTHKGEFQVEVEQTDSFSVEVSAGTSTVGLSKTEAKKAHRTIKNVVKKDESDTAAENSNIEDPNLTITIPSSEGPDPMLELMGEDEIKDADFLPPIVSLDEFMQSLDSEPPFENIPDKAGKAKTLSDKDDSEAGSDSKSSGQASQVPVKIIPDKPGSSDASNLKSYSGVKLNDIPTKTETIVSGISASKGEHVWEGMLQLNVSAMTSVTCTFKSGERTSTKEWPGILEIKGRVRLDAFEKFLQELPKSRSRAVMVIHVACKEGTTETECQSLVEAADSYILDGRTGFAEPAYGVELYCCPRFARTLEMLAKILSKDQVQALSALDNGLIGVVVWRKAQLTSPNSTSHHNHTSKRQHFTSVRHQDKDSTNMNSNSSSKQPPLATRGGHLYPKPPTDDEEEEDDDVPPGFGPGTTRDEDDLPEFNYSGGSNTLGPQYSAGYHSQQGLVASPHLHSQTSSRPVDQMRELIQKYGQTNNNAPLGAPMQQWNNNDDDDDDDIPEWQPTSQQQPPALQVNRFQQPMNAPLQTMHVQDQQNAAQQWQQGTWWVPPGSESQQFVNGAQMYRNNVGTGQPSWQNDASNNRGF